MEVVFDLQKAKELSFLLSVLKMNINDLKITESEKKSLFDTIDRVHDLFEEAQLKEVANG